MLAAALFYVRHDWRAAFGAGVEEDHVNGRADRDCAGRRAGRMLYPMAVAAPTLTCLCAIVRDSGHLGQPRLRKVAAFGRMLAATPTALWVSLAGRASRASFKDGGWFLEPGCQPPAPTSRFR